MHEFVITRNNHGIDPSLHIWGGEIAVYLFLGGLVAGMMLISGYFILTGRTKHTNSSCFTIPLVGLVALSLGMLALFLDLEHKLYVWRMYTTFMWWSPMSWGAWILIFVYPIMALNAIIRVPKFIAERFSFVSGWSQSINSKPFLIKFIGAMSMIFGGLLGTYTGILLSAFVARPAWNTSMLWILFLISGLSSAAAFVHLISKDSDESRMLAKADNGFLVAEIMVIFLIIVGYLSSSQVMTEGANLILSGPYAATFWVLVFGMGIVIPLIIQLYAVNLKIHHTPVAPILVMLGGLALRFVIVSAGQYSHWSTAVYHLP